MRIFNEKLIFKQKLSNPESENMNSKFGITETG